jgi:hypothetical protein
MTVSFFGILPFGFAQSSAQKIEFPNDAQAGAATTPPKGSAERKEIMDAIRAYMKDANIEMVFVVNFLKVDKGWAWANVNPQSPDGQSHYEPIAVLLAKKNGTWKVVIDDCSQDPEATNPCPAMRKEFNGQLKKKFPEMPLDILPTD